MSSAPSLFHNRDFMLLWGGQLASTLGSMACHVIYPLLILALTDSAAAAGLAGAFRFIPYLIFSLPVGALIDRWDRKRVMILSDLGRAIAVGSLPVAMAFDALTLGHVYIVCFAEGALFCFFNIAEVAALPRVVPRPQLPEATAFNEAGFGTAGIVGPPLGTILYQAFGRAIPFVFDALTYVVSLFSLAFIRTPFRTAATAEAASAKRDLAGEIMEGLRWLWGKPLIRFMAFLTGGVNLAFSGLPLITIVLAKELGADDAAIGVIFGISGVGGILGSLVGGRVQRRFTFGQVITATIWIQAAALLSLVVVPGYFWIGVMSAIAGFFGPIYNVVQFSYRVALIPDALQGRVNSVFRLLAFGFIPVGAALSGVVIEGFGAKAAVMTFAGFMFMFAILSSFNRHVREAAPIERATP
jgi:predicted MFS family arabinose efflux permease